MDGILRKDKSCKLLTKKIYKHYKLKEIEKVQKSTKSYAYNESWVINCMCLKAAIKIIILNFMIKFVKTVNYGILYTFYSKYFHFISGIFFWKISISN